MFHIVLLEPEIPQNTGNIARTCTATDTSLHLIEPLGFSLDQKQVRRAGLDYWDDLDLSVYPDWNAFVLKNRDNPLYFFTTKSETIYTDLEYPENAMLIFGKESAGIPEEILVNYPDNCVRIPMAGDSRSLNLSNAAAIAIYEAHRQNSFRGLNTQGQLHRLRWT